MALCNPFSCPCTAHRCNNYYFHKHNRASLHNSRAITGQCRSNRQSPENIAKPPQQLPPSSLMSFDASTSSIVDVTLYSSTMTRSQAELRLELQSAASSACYA
ncbi:hypothetical protein M0R45_016395 [Rubus argutus]|uniref:Uncharacterized protein n=1 Tax=Rubus argutus TaxID=59490 RepID=A0AAW1XRU3_RUBAR